MIETGFPRLWISLHLVMPVMDSLEAATAKGTGDETAVSGRLIHSIPLLLLPDCHFSSDWD
jgi:hypothetical protein